MPTSSTSYITGTGNGETKIKPQIVGLDTGKHGANLNAKIAQLVKQGVYRDQSCIVLIPAFGSVPTKAVASWWNLYFPPNQPVIKVFALGMEVGAAYSSTIEAILANPDTAKFKYLCTVEHDNLPPPDGVVKLIERMDAHPEYMAISGLYFTKGEGGVPQIWGNPKESPLNFKPQLPVPGELVECCGIGMGFAVWRMEHFKNPNLKKPWFETKPGYTQDLYHWSEARKHGARCAVDCGVIVGHYDEAGKFGPPDMVW